jgi:Ca2+-binding RTX toxin-like protein
MAVVTGANTAVNMGDPVDYGAMLFSFGVGTPTSTAFTTFNPETNGTWQFQGAGFGAFDGGIPTVGTITSIVYLKSGALALTVSGISLSMATFFGFLAADNLSGLLNFIFADADTISGSTAYDNLRGYGGNDTITGGAGGDAMFGGVGDDVINAGADFDVLHGEDGNDLLQGNAGGDQIDGGAGADTLEGGSGQDRLDGGSGNDVINGGDNEDAIISTSGVDTIDGGAGVDSLTLDRSSSSLAYSVVLANLATSLGATLADGTIVKNVERFVITTGSGADNFVANWPLPTGGLLIGPNIIDGGAGVDRLTADFSASTGPISDYLSWRNIEELVLRTGSANDSIVVSSGNNELYGGGGADTLTTGDGNDVLSGQDGNDVLYAAGGNNTISGGDGDDLITAGVGVEVIDGGAGTDRLEFAYFGNATNALTFSLFGMSSSIGATLFNGSVLRNIERFELFSGSGADTLFVSSGLRGLSRYYAGAGDDTLVADLSAETANIALRGDQSSATIDTPSALPESFMFQVQNVERVVVVGGSGNDTLAAWGGDDRLEGNAGNDVLNGAAGADTVLGGSGNDTISGGTGANSLSGGDGDDQLTSSGADFVDGGAGVDRLILARTDTGVGLQMSMSSNGGLSASDGTVIVNMEAFDIRGGGGVDVLTLPGGEFGVDKSFDGGGAFDRVVGDFSAVTTTISLRSYFLLFGASHLTTINVEEWWITGGSGNDTLYGNSGADVLSGGAGADEIFGYGGDDVLNGGDGADSISGGEGVNQAFGGAGTIFWLWAVAPVCWTAAPGMM